MLDLSETDTSVVGFKHDLFSDDYLTLFLLYYF